MKKIINQKHLVTLVYICSSFLIFCQSKEELYNRARNFDEVNRDSAIYYWDQYIKIDSTNSEAFEWRARNLEWFQSEKAILDYKRAIDLDFKNLNARTGLGNVYAKQKSYKLALEQFQFVLDHGGHDGVLLNMSNIYEENENFDELFKCANKMTKLNDDMLSREGYMKLGNMYFKQMKYNLALDNYEFAIKAEWIGGFEYYKIALTLIELDQRSKACQYLDKYLNSEDYEYGGDIQGVKELINKNCK